MTMFRRLSSALTFAALAVAPAMVQGQIHTERVTFAPGASAATVKGTIRGDQTVDYVLGAAAGQTMSVSLTISHPSGYFNVMAPGSQGEAMFIGSTSGNTFAAPLPVAGDYTVRVYLMRSAARRNESASYTITFSITKGPAGDAVVAGTPYHATGTVPCSIGTDPPRSAQCGFGVIRGAGGNAEVHLTQPGFAVTSAGATKRVLRFAGSSVTSPDPGVRLKATKAGDEWSVSINDREHFAIPEAVILGG